MIAHGPRIQRREMRRDLQAPAAPGAQSSGVAVFD
jgi:hypothetical protein